MWSACASMTTWSRTRWLVAVLGGLIIAVLVALPTAVIPNPVFGRSIAVTWWSYPVVVVTAILGGLLVATYVRTGEPSAAVPNEDEIDGATKLGMAGTLVTFFAVGCPVCNKLILLALGASGAVTWFAPFQPFLAVASVALMAVALRIRLRNETSCPVSI